MEIDKPVKTIMEDPGIGELKKEIGKAYGDSNSNTTGNGIYYPTNGKEVF